MVEVKKDQLRETLKHEAERQADTARQEVGEIVVDATGRYFPEAVRVRRRRDIASGFLVGVIVGFVARYLVGER